MVEFYQGILMAVDSIRHDGLDIEVLAMHSGSSAADMDSLLATNSLKGCDVVFGPLDAAQLPALSDYCDIHQLRLVVPFSSSAQHVIGHPLYYQVCETQGDVQSAASQELAQTFGNCNYVFVTSGDGNYEGESFVKRMKDQLANKGVTGHQINLTDNDETYEQTLSEPTPNIVVIDAPSLKAINLLLPKLEQYQRQHPNSGITLLGYPDWQTYTSKRLTDFFAFNTYIYTSFYRHPLEDRITSFERQYMRWFGQPMLQTYPRYAMMGFDLGYYFLRGLQIFGNELEERHAEVPNYPLQHRVRFERTATNSGFVNRNVQLVHFTKQHNIETITVKP